MGTGRTVAWPARPVTALPGDLSARGPAATRLWGDPRIKFERAQVGLPPGAPPHVGAELQEVEQADAPDLNGALEAAASGVKSAVCSRLSGSTARFRAHGREAPLNRPAICFGPPARPRAAPPARLRKSPSRARCSGLSASRSRPLNLAVPAVAWYSGQPASTCASLAEGRIRGGLSTKARRTARLPAEHRAAAGLQLSTMYGTGSADAQNHPLTRPPLPACSSRSRWGPSGRAPRRRGPAARRPAVSACRPRRRCLRPASSICLPL